MPILFQLDLKGVDPEKVYSVELPSEIPAILKGALMTHAVSVKAKPGAKMTADVYSGKDMVGKIKYLGVSV